MIRTETVNIDGREFVHTWSDENRRVCRDGQSWDEAYDPLNTGRTYTEGDEIPDEEATPEEALSILLGGADD